MKHLVWDGIERESLNELTVRQAIHGEKLTLARIHLAKGAVVPRHAHSNEQISMLEQGRLRFVFDGREMILEAGQMMLIAPDEPHAVIALEDSRALDLFAPAREDWIRGDDTYLRQTQR